MRRIGWAVVAALGVLAACVPQPAPRPAPSPSVEGFTQAETAEIPALQFAVKGDWGFGSAAQSAVTAQMCGLQADGAFEFVLTTGDNFYPSGYANRRNFEDPERCLNERPNHTWKAAWGNHDVLGNSTSKVLGGDRYYHFDEGPAAFFVLDSNRTNDGKQRSWLASSLSTSTAEFKIVAFHHPPFTNGRHHPPDANVRKQWVPLFVENGVDLVLSGHQHIYEHLPVDGVDYVITGGGGAPLVKCGKVKAGEVCKSTYHFLSIVVSETRIDVSAIDSRGELIDSFVVAGKSSDAKS